MKQTIGCWIVEVDVPLTQHCYASIADRRGCCDCISCRNFEALDFRAHPPELLDIAKRVGIDVWKWAELCMCRDLGDEQYEISGWYHFVGKIVEGRDFFVSQGENSHSLEFESISKYLRVGISDRRSLASSAFQDHAVVQLDFVAPMTWVLSEPYKWSVQSYLTSNRIFDSDFN